MLETCERDGIAFVPFFPLATGALGSPPALIRPAERLEVPTTTIALAWLLRRSPILVPIPGTRSVTHLRSNIAAADIADELTAEEVRHLTAVEDESSAQLHVMSRQMRDAVAARRRSGSAGA